MANPLKPLRGLNGSMLIVAGITGGGGVCGHTGPGARRPNRGGCANLRKMWAGRFPKIYTWGFLGARTRTYLGLYVTVTARKSGLRLLPDPSE